MMELDRGRQGQRQRAEPGGGGGGGGGPWLIDHHPSCIHDRL